MKKRALSLLLVLVMLCSMIPMMAFAAEAETCEICGEPIEEKKERIELYHGSFNNASAGDFYANETFASCVNYELKAGHKLVLETEGYLFNFRMLDNNNYETQVIAMQSEPYVAESDMTIAIRVRTPDTKTLTEAQALAIVLYDVYTLKHDHKVSFDANGGTGTMADKAVGGKEYTLPECTFTAPAGKRFKAWSVDGTEKAVGDKIDAIAAVTVSAVWEDIPAGHTCTIKSVEKVAATCAKAGKESYYKCDGCSKFFEDAAGTKQIADLSAWGNITKLNHKDENKDGLCDACQINLAEAGEYVVDTDKLFNTITVKPGQLLQSTGKVQTSDKYGYVINYPLKKGHTLSISDTDYVFSVREKQEDGTYIVSLKSADAESYTATKDMVVGMLIRKPDSSPVTAEELAGVQIYDSQYAMIEVEGSVQRFTVDAKTITGGTDPTLAAIFLPASYSESGEATPWIIMTNGLNGYLTEEELNGNAADDVALMKNYLDNGYAVVVVDNTAHSVKGANDSGNPQQVDSYWKAYDYVLEHFNVEEYFSLHSRSRGTYAAMRMMREKPELIRCALMTGPRLSLKNSFDLGGSNAAWLAKQFGFADASGKTWEPEKAVGYDPYTDVKGEEYALPPTFWMLGNDSNDTAVTQKSVIMKIENHGNVVQEKNYRDTDHSGICRLNTEASFADALAFLQKYQNSNGIVGPGHKVSYDANGGTGTMEAVEEVSGEYTLPACGFTAPAGKQFKAWSVDGAEKAAGDKITVEADTTVTAVWEDVPVETTTPSTEDVGTNANDNSVVWIVVLCVAAAGAVAAVVLGKKKSSK